MTNTDSGWFGSPDGGMIAPVSDLPRAAPALPICASVMEPSTAEVLERLRAVTPHCGVIEIRLDAGPPGAIDVGAVVAASPRPLIFTARPRREGGLRDTQDAARLEELLAAARAGADYVDVEWDALALLPPLPSETRLIVSRHAFQGFPADLERFLDSVRDPRAHVQKVAIRVEDAAQALTLLERARQEDKPTVAIAMGFPGVISRLAGTRYGAPFVYAAADGDRPAAPGQLAASALARLLAGRRITQRTHLYGVLGKPLAHSRSPALMNAAFARLGLDALYGWLETTDPAGLLERVRCDPGVRGFSVTIPHKRSVLRWLERQGVLSDGAQATGAVNTLVRSAGRWVGHNTDALAAEQLLRGALGSGAATARVGVLGCGGAARAAVWAARAVGAEARVYARNPASRRALADSLGAVDAGDLAQVPTADGRRLDVLVNATPLGMVPDLDGTPTGAEPFGPAVIAYDLVYTPEDTRWLRMARERGAQTITGVEHFVLQARAQLALWLGDDALPQLDPAWLRDQLEL